MAGPITFVVTEAERDLRLDRLIANHASVSRRVARLWVAQGCVRVDGRILRILSRMPGAGAEIRLEPPAAGAGRAEAALRLRLEVLYLDRWIVAVAKPAGLLSETDRVGSPSLETEVPKLLAARGERQQSARLVHRLDAGTSGVTLLGRTPQAVRRLNAAFARGEVEKEYLALCVGDLAAAIEVSAAIGRGRGVRHVIDERGGKAATTRFEPVSSTAAASLVRALPRTGRTHQIRVHLAHLGHPIYGDRLYGGPGYGEGVPPEPIVRPMLHAHRLTAPHPHSGERLALTAAPTPDFVALARALGLWPERGA